jgi:hypothetical protein
MKHLVVATCLMIAGFGGLGVVPHGVALAATGGNSDAAHACQQGGYLTLQGSDGTTFKNEGDCVSYAARGGTIAGVSACSVTSTSGCLTFNGLKFTDPTYGNTITLTGSTSFVDTCTSGYCFPSSFPNNLATGGGTYLETDSSGTLISSGQYRVADTTGSSEGLLSLDYVDGTGASASTCGAATGARGIAIVATLIDGRTGTTKSVYIGTATGTLITASPGQYQGEVAGTSDYSFDFGAATVPDSTITC